MGGRGQFWSSRAAHTGVPSGGAPALAVAIGASAGGPKAIERILCALPADFPVPILVCQHIVEGATATWAQHLDRRCALHVREASDGDGLKPGCVLLSPGHRHMMLAKGPKGVRVRLYPNFADSLYVPSIDYFMRSASEVFGSRLVAVLLTGMGDDGSQGMMCVRKSGGHTLCEALETASFESMPRSADEIGAAAEVVPIDRMAEMIELRAAGRV